MGGGEGTVRRRSPVSQRLQTLPFPRILSDYDEKFSER